MRSKLRVCAFLAISIVLMACGGGGSSSGGGSSANTGSTGPQSRLTVTDVSITSNGWIMSIDANVPWSIETEDWVRLSPTSSSGSQTVSATIDYRVAPVGSLDIAYTVSATDSSGLVSNNRVLIENGIRLNPTILGLSKIWGVYRPSELQVSTHLDWVIGTDLPGISFSPSSGTGSQTVQVHYDQSQFDVGGDYSGTVTAASGEIEETLPISITMNAPVLRYDHDGASFKFTKGTFVSSMEQQIALSFEEGAIVPWRLSGLPDWLVASKTSGQTQDLDLFISPADINLLDGLYNETFALTLDIPGAPINWEINVALEADGLKLHARDYALAHGSYAGESELTGNIAIGNFPEQEIVLEATADQDWISFGLQKGDSVSYTLATGGLAAGIHSASIVVSALGNESITPAIVQLAVYKASEFEYNNEKQISDDLIPIATDKLLPYLYMGEPDSNQLQRLNLHTNNYETPLSFTAEAEITQYVFSDDGQILVTDNQATQTIEAWNLRTGERMYESVPLDNVNDIQYLRASGKAFLYVGDTWLEAATGEQVETFEDSGATVALGAVPLEISPIGHAFYGLNDECDVYVQQLAYNGAVGKILLQDSAIRAHSECSSGKIFTASNSDHLFLNKFVDSSFTQRYAITELNVSFDGGYGPAIGTEVFAAALAQSGELYRLSKRIEGEDVAFYYEYFTNEFVPYLHYTIPSNKIPDAHLFVTGDSNFTSYFFSFDDDVTSKWIHTLYNSY